MNHQLTKVTLIATALATAVAALGVHFSGQLFPWVPGLVGGVVLLWVVLGNRGPFITWVIVVSVFGTGVRAFMYLWTPSMIGLDPDRVSVAVNRIINQGIIDAIRELGFYSQAPFSHLLAANYGILAGIDGQSAVAIYTLLLGGCIPILAAAIAKRATSRLAGGIAATLTSVAPVTIYFGIGPIPQSLAAVFLPLFLLSLVLYRSHIESRRNTAAGVVVGISLLGLLFTHKFGLLVAFAILVCATIIFVINDFRGTEGTKRERFLPFYSQTTVVVGILVIIQFAFLTTWVNAVVLTAIVPLFSPSVVAAQPSPSFLAAVGPTLVQTVVDNLDRLVILPLSAVVCIGIWWRSTNPDIGLLLGSAAVTVLFVVFSIISPGGASTIRVLLFGEPVLLILIAIGVSWGFDRSSPSLSPSYVISMVVVVIVVMAIVGSPTTVPDHPNNYRKYLTEDEISAKNTITQVADEPVGMDGFYTHELTPSQANRPSAPYVTGNATGSPGTIPALGLLNGRFTNGSVAIRTGVDRVRGPGGTWYLQYDPEKQLSASVHYNRAYDNGAVVYFTTRP